jgi:hypothetical protein
MENRSTGGDLAAVITGWRVPGLCLEIGRDHYGLSFGYLARQQLAVVSPDVVASLKHPKVSPRFLSNGNTNAPWAFGHLRMRGAGSPSHHHAIVTGKALAGLGAGLGDYDTSLGFVLDGRQRAVVVDENIQLDFDQDARRWPGCDLFEMKVISSIPTDQSNNGRLGVP